MAEPESSAPSAIGSSPAWRDEPFRRLVEGVRDYAIFLLDTEGNVASWNLGAERLKGYKPSEIIGRHFSTFYTQAAIDKRWPQHELETAARLGRFEDEGWRVRKDGTLFWANVVITAMRDHDGRLLGYSKITRDLTERRENEERLRRSEERFRLIVEGAEDYAIFLLDPTGHVQSWNKGAERIKGYREPEIIGKHFSIFYPPEALDVDWPDKELREAERLGRFEDEGWRLKKDGTRFWANVVITALRDDEGKLRGFSKITRDLTERRETEERLRQTEERFRLLLEGVEDYAVFMLDTTGRVTSWNTGAERVTGWTAAEITGHSFDRFYATEDRSAGRAAEDLHRARLNRHLEEQGWRLRKDGSLFWAEVAITALHDEHGEARGFAHVMRDLTERKRMENLEEEGRHLTEFLAMLAHELRNPLAPIRSALAIIGAHRGLPPQVAWSRDVIERQTAQLVRLVDDLLDVSRITRGKLRMKSGAMDLNDAVQRAIEAGRPLVEARRHELKVTLAASPIAVNGDMTRLTQVMVNVLNNAAKYTSEGGRIELSTAVEGREAVFRVRDNGVGIPPQLLERVFDVFAQGERTLDRSEGGLGIGLTLARRIVGLHGGTIVARSEGAGHGSEFEVRLPRLDLAVPKPEIGASPGVPTAARHLKVMVVDDNEDAAHSLAMLLGMAGHTATIEHTGHGALERALRERPDVVLLDLGLPGLSGYEVAQALRARPEGRAMRIYALTGYGNKEDRQRSAAAGFDGHLVKPVMPSELIALIESTGPAA